MPFRSAREARLYAINELPRIIGEAKLPKGAPRAEVAGLAYEKFLKNLRGGWLLDFVLDIAAKYYKVDRSRLVVREDILEDFELRIGGLAKVIARDSKDVDKIVALATAELDSRIRGNYLATLVFNVGRDLRRQFASSRSQGGGEDIPEKDIPDDPEHTSWTLDAETEERLKLALGAGARSQAHEMHAFAWSGLGEKTAGRMPQAISEDLGGIRLDALAEAWRHTFAGGTDRPHSQNDDLFAGLLAKSRGSARRMADYWEPAETVEAWVKSIDKAAAENPQLIPGKALHLRIAWLYRRKLSYTAERIVAELGPQRPDRLLAEFVAEFVEHSGLSRERVKEDLAPFLNDQGDIREALSYDFKPYRKVKHWSGEVVRRRRAAELRQLRGGLKIVFSSGFPLWQAMAFLFCRGLGKTPAAVAATFGARPLEFMKAALVEELKERWRSPQSGIENALRGLARPVSLNRTLRDHAGSEDLSAELRRRSDEVFDAVKGRLTGNPSLRLYAIRHGFL